MTLYKLAAIVLVLCFAVLGQAKTSVKGLSPIGIISKKQLKRMKMTRWKNGTLKTLASDLNYDGRYDVIDLFTKDGELKARKKDRNFDGKWDTLEKYALTKKDKFVRQIDTNFDGKYDRRESRWIKGETIVTEVRKDLNRDGSFDRIITHRSPARQPAGNQVNPSCQPHGHEEATLQAIREIASRVSSPLGPISNGYHSTSLGILVEESCVSKIGEKRLLSMLENASTKGLECLWSLNTPQSREHAHRLASFLLSTSPEKKLICNSTDYNWVGENEDAFALGSVEAKVSSDASVAVHFNPTRITETKPLNPEWDGTLFHEWMHNIGNSHGVGVDYTYGCHGCCFSNEQASTASCAICKGDFTSTTDKGYWRAVFDTVKEPKKIYQIVPYLIQDLKVDPTNPDTQVVLIEALEASYQKGLASALAQAYLEKFPHSSENRTAVSAAVTRLTAEKPTETETHLAKSIVHLWSRDPMGADQSLRSALRADNEGLLKTNSNLRLIKRELFGSIINQYQQVTNRNDPLSKTRKKEERQAADAAYHKFYQEFGTLDQD